MRDAHIRLLPTLKTVQTDAITQEVFRREIHALEQVKHTSARVHLSAQSSSKLGRAPSKQPSPKPAPKDEAICMGWKSRIGKLSIRGCCKKDSIPRPKCRKAEAHLMLPRNEDAASTVRLTICLPPVARSGGGLSLCRGFLGPVR